MIIKKKCLPEFFEKIISGEKKFEVRLADFECQVGDVLLLEEWDPETKQYTGRILSRKITYVLKTKRIYFYDPDDVERYGYQIMSLHEV